MRAADDQLPLIATCNFIGNPPGADGHHGNHSIGRAQQVAAFVSDIRALYLGEPAADGRAPYETVPYTFQYTSLPILGEIAVTYRCNNACLFCYAGCGAGGRTGGESLLRGDLEQRIGFAGRCGLQVNLITNGTLADPERARRLHDAGLRTAQASIESPEAAPHGALTARPMCVFEPILSSAAAEGGDVVITPYLKLDKDREGHQVPEDIRLMVEPRRKPADFLDVQMQMTVNKGPNGSVPYMYSVFLCKGKGATYQALSRERFGDYEREPGGDADYGYVVVRQKTSGTGYHTTDADVRRLFAMVKEKLLAMRA